ncbi:MAG: carbonic anhydrase [Phycisphaerales bacterium]|jgi:carbonic anhydrase|nr:carbonic anhydrase [Phycisphaerales bacterium]
MRIKILCVVTLLAAAGLPTAIGSSLISPPEHATPTQPAAKSKHEATKSETKPESKSATKSPGKATTGTKTESKTESKPEGKPEADKDAHDENDKAAGSHDEPIATSASKPVAKMTLSLSADGTITAEQALTFLTEGNARWVANTPLAPNTDSSRRADVTENGQKPFVTVLTCADSRLPVERLFDRGVGDVFVVRVAGNVAGDSETGTIEYGVGHLNTPLLVVMGHTKCGAVAAAASGAEVHGHIAQLVSQITPAVERAKRANPNLIGAELAAASVKENVWQTVFQLFKTSPEFLEAVQGGKVKVVGAVCDISTGKVEWMGEHPWQSELIAAFAPKSGNTAHASKNATHDSHADPHATQGESTPQPATQTASHGEHDEHDEH